MMYQIVATGEYVEPSVLGLHFPNMSLPIVLSQSDLDRMGVAAIPDPQPTAEQLAAQAQVTQQAKIDAIWRAADAYTSSYISGVAIGLLTLGVIQGKPKALAVTAWSSSVWDEYYRRKALVTVDSADNHDFSSFGPIPHTVPELRAELGM